MFAEVAGCGSPEACKAVRYSLKAEKPADGELDALESELEAKVRGLEMELVELDVFRGGVRKGVSSVQVRAIVYRPGALGTGDCARAYRAMRPSLESAFPGRELSVEVSTPGINRRVRDGAELALYKGRGVRCWRTDVSDWSSGLLEEADGQGIILKGKEGTIRLDYGIIAKARLDPSQEG